MGTTTIRKLFKARPARTSEDIGARISTIARRLKRNVKNGKGLSLEEARYIARKLAAYGERLQAPASIVSVPENPVFPTIQGQ